MVNVKSKLCEQDGCPTEASFGVVGNPGRRFCYVHKLSGMVNKAREGRMQ